MSKIDCIVPFYNEEERIAKTLQKLGKVTNITSIICVNDGSTDKSAAVVNGLSKEFPNILLVSLGKNEGKTAAIKVGLERVKTKFVLLYDADLTNIIPGEINKIINILNQNASIDTIIFKRVNTGRLEKYLHFDSMLTGERIIKTKDLLQIITTNVTGYSLEVAINEFMISNSKKILIVESSATNPKRLDKWGFKKSLTSNLNMLVGFMKYPGIFKIMRQIRFFGKTPSVK